MSTSTIDTETLENSVQTGVNQLLRGGWGEALKTILFALFAAGHLSGDQGHFA